MAQFVELNNWVRYFALLISESRNLAVRNDTELLQWNVVSGKLRFARTSFCHLINNACRASVFQQCKLFFLFFLFSPFFRRLFCKQCAQRVKFTSFDRIKVFFLTFVTFVIFSSSKRSKKKKKKKRIKESSIKNGYSKRYFLNFLRNITCWSVLLLSSNNNIENNIERIVSISINTIRSKSEYPIEPETRAASSIPQETLSVARLQDLISFHR